MRPKHLDTSVTMRSAKEKGPNTYFCLGRSRMVLKLELYLVPSVSVYGLLLLQILTCGGRWKVIHHLSHFWL
jgi:hypothetical protein